jgi:RND family efflux transporter MFP subunit
MRQTAKARRLGHVRAGRVLDTTIVALVVLVVGGAAGAVLSHYRLTGNWNPLTGVGSGEPAAGESEQTYTCGMHPWVIAHEPGDCPICHMRLVPRKDRGEDESTEGPQERRVLYWRAPMDPSYVSDSPGKSPMGMDLVPVYADEAESAVGKTITIDPVTRQNMGVRTTRVQRGPLVKTIRTVGRVDYDEQTVTFIDTKFEGWITTLYVDETGMPVQKGDPLFDVYSPKLWESQEEYLAALRGVDRLSETTLPEALEEARRLVEAARVQLDYFDITDAQIEELRRTRTSRKTLTIYSPSSGIVTEKMALEGMNVKPGMRLYTIADLSKVWVYVDVYEYQLPWVAVDQHGTMTLPYIPAREFNGRVVYIYPYLEKQTRVIKVRLEFENPTLELKPDMYANVTLRSDLDRDALLIPREAYIDSGIRKVAFIGLGDGKFQPREIQTGVEAENGMVEVLYGLDEGDRVVTSGQFMLDAESKLREANAKMMEVQKSRETTPQQDSAQVPRANREGQQSAGHDP